MKRALCLILTLLCLSLCACGAVKSEQIPPLKVTIPPQRTETISPTGSLPTLRPTPAPTPAPIPAPVNTLDELGIDLSPIESRFNNEGDLQYSLFKSIKEISDELDWFVTPIVTREGNPELSFDSKTQAIKSVLFYLNYYGNSSKSEAREIVDEYTDILNRALSALYPNLKVEFVAFFWQIPVISKDSLYSESFFYYNENGDLIRSE